MASPVRRALKKAFPKLASWHKAAALRRKAHDILIKDTDSFLYSTGWMKSLDLSEPVDTDGNRVPWMNYAVVRLLKDRLTGDLDLFEYGSGYSTAFFAQRVRSVISVEHDESWYRQMKGSLPPNVELIYQTHDYDGEYCRLIASAGRSYDVVVVDGRDRVNCIKQGIPALSEKGVLLLDDSEREQYRVGIDWAKASGFRALDFESMKPRGRVIHRATVLYREGNCLGI